MSAALLLGLGAAAGYGLGDFLSGLYGRRLGTVQVLLVGQLAGLAVLLVALGVLRPAELRADDLAWGGLAGVAGVLGWVWLLRGFRAGRISLVSPVSSLGAAGVPVVFDLVVGSPPSGLALAGMASGLAAIWLVGTGIPQAPRPGRVAPGLWYGLASGVGFAVVYLALGRTDPASGLWPVVALKGVVIAFAVGLALARRRPWALPANSLLGLAIAGIVVTLASVCFLWAAQAGLVSAAAVLASLSPLVTVLLARLVLAERMVTRQVAGLGCAGIALVLLALG